MNKKLKAGLTAVGLIFSASLNAQTGSSGVGATSGATTTTTSPSGTGVGVGMGQTQGTSQLPANGSAVTTDAQAVQNAQNARANSAQANPAQTSQQATGGGIFGPSSGPGIFGPASTPMTTDIYGNQLPASGTVQPSQQTIPVQGARGNQQVRSQNPISYDANGQPLPSTLYPQANLPKDINPILPSGAQQTQPGQTGQTQPLNSGTVTGR